MWYMHDGMGWWMVWGGLMALLFWGSIIALAVWVIHSLVRPDHGDAARQRTPLEIAQERYARGEISREEFEQIRKDLREG